MIRKKIGLFLFLAAVVLADATALAAPAGEETQGRKTDRGTEGYFKEVKQERCFKNEGLIKHFKDRRAIRHFIEETYPESYRVICIPGRRLKAGKLRKRRRRNIVYVAKWVSFSRGRKGVTRDGKRIRYNKKVKRGKKVFSYLIYDPRTGKEDNVAAVVDNGRIR